MRILSLDFDPLFGAEEDIADSFDSDTSVFDFDIVIWDPEASFKRYNVYSNQYQGLPSLSDSASSRIKADVLRRRAEFKEFVASGKSLIVIARPPQSCYVKTGDVQFSGTGRNARQTNIVTSFDILSALPVDSPGFQRASGNQIEPVGENSIAAHLRKNIKNLTYTATMSSAPGTVLARIKGTERVVASYVQLGEGGYLLILPATTFAPKHLKAGPKWPEAAVNYQQDLVAAIEAMSGSTELARPVWADNYFTAKTDQTKKAVTKQQAVIEKARNRLAVLQGLAEAEELRNQLYLGTGRQLELRVRDVLVQLGGDVSEPEPGRDDWRVSFGEETAVVEVKGVSKSAAEKHAAQLEKWVSGAYEQTGLMPKGILIANTWRDLPLDERLEDDFPAQMIPYSTSRGHCLLTGLDLFVISAEIEADPSKAEYWREKIMATSGRLDGVPHWSTQINRSVDDTDPS